MSMRVVIRHLSNNHNNIHHKYRRCGHHKCYSSLSVTKLHGTIPMYSTEDVKPQNIFQK